VRDCLDSCQRGARFWTPPRVSSLASDLPVQHRTWEYLTEKFTNKTPSEMTSVPAASIFESPEPVLYANGTTWVTANGTTWVTAMALVAALVSSAALGRVKSFSNHEKLEHVLPQARLKFRDGHGPQPRRRRDRGLLLLFVLTVAGVAGAEAACSGCAPGTSGPDAGPCDPCPLGMYKEVAGSHACSACPVDTYSTTEGADSAAVCISCPPRSSTKGAAGRGSALSCECVTNAYPRVSSGPAECLPCPKGALCTGGDCALQNVVNGLALCAGDADAILGKWSPGPEGMYVLISCPPGHQIVNTTHIVQQCKPCEPSTYIVDVLKPCSSCPLGASCPGLARNFLLHMEERKCFAWLLDSYDCLFLPLLPADMVPLQTLQTATQMVLNFCRRLPIPSGRLSGLRAMMCHDTGFSSVRQGYEILVVNFLYFMDVNIYLQQ